MTELEDGRWYWFALGVLAVWRVTHLLHLEHGPFGAVAKLRAGAHRLGLGELAGCFYCLSLWVAAPAALLLASGWRERLIAWLALSAGAILIEVKALGGPSSPSREEQ